MWLGSFRATLNADEIYALALIGDIWADAPFRWHLPPANGLFPGLLVAGLGFAAGLDGVAFHLFFAAVFSILLFIATGCVVRQTGLEKRHIWSAAALAVVLICFVGDPHQELRRMLFLPGSHAGVVLVALFAFALVAKSIESGMPRMGWLFALVLLSAFSDMPTLLQVVLPIVGAMILIGWEQPQLRRRAAALGAWVVLAALAGMALYSAEIDRHLLARLGRTDTQNGSSVQSAESALIM